jgi:hypothetical protein
MQKSAEPEKNKKNDIYVLRRAGCCGTTAVVANSANEKSAKNLLLYLHR